MSSRAQTLRGLVALGLTLLGAGRAEAQLVSKSPFLSAAAGGAASPTAGAPLEYRGMMQTAQGIKARIVDPSRKAGVWLLANERDPGFDFVVKQIDTEHDTVTVDYQGRSLTLAQHVAKIASAGAPPNFPMAMANPAANMPPAITNSVVINPTPADEQRRLEAVAAEVARRRQLREQASQQVSQGVPVTLPQLQRQLQQTPQNANQQPVSGQRQRGSQRTRGNQP